MASPIGTVPAGYDIGYDNSQFVSGTVFYPTLPQNVSAGTYSTGSVNTASTETTGTQTLSTFARLTTAQFYVNPLFVDRDIVFRGVEMGVSANTVAGTGNVTGGWMMGLYKQSTTWATASGTTDMSSGTVLTNLSKFGYAFKLSQNSVTAQTYTLWQGNDSGSTANSTTTTGNISADFTGPRQIRMLSTTTPQTLTGGQYYVFHGFTKTSAGANVFSANHALFLEATTARGTYLGSTSEAAVGPFIGSITTQVSSTHSTGTTAVAAWVNCLPDSIVQSQISATLAVDQKFLVPSFTY